MPNINLSRVLLSVMLADKVVVIRRRQVIGTNGRVSVSKLTIPRVVGTVTMAGPDDLDRLDDHQRLGRVISFVSKFKLQGPALTGRTLAQPDLIIWRGDQFVVATVDPYPQFGSGFTQTLATSLDSVDQPASFDPNGAALIFNQRRNSVYVPITFNQ